MKDETTSLLGLGTNSTRHVGSRHVRLACDLERPYCHEDLLIELPRNACTVPGLEIAVHLFADRTIILTYLPGNG